MTNRILVLLAAAVLLLAMPVITFSQSLTLTDQEVIYELPYPGILPDNPFYFLKNMRDSIMVLGTRDHMKKTELLLLLSDKKISMAPMLLKKGKDKLAVDTIREAEEMFMRIPDILNTSKGQGVGASSEFINELKASNAKHRQVIESMLKDVPQGQHQAINQVLKLNKQNLNLLLKIKI